MGKQNVILGFYSHFLITICTKGSHSLIHAKVNHAHEVTFTLWGFCTGKFQHGGQNSWHYESAQPMQRF